MTGASPGRLARGRRGRRRGPTARGYRVGGEIRIAADRQRRADRGITRGHRAARVPLRDGEGDVARDDLGGDRAVSAVIAPRRRAAHGVGRGKLDSVRARRGHSLANVSFERKMQ